MLLTYSFDCAWKWRSLLVFAVTIECVSFHGRCICLNISRAIICNCPVLWYSGFYQAAFQLFPIAWKLEIILKLVLNFYYPCFFLKNPLILAQDLECWCHSQHYIYGLQYIFSAVRIWDLETFTETASIITRHSSVLWHILL